MKIKSFAVKNYRCFTTEVKIDIKPLTFFVSDTTGIGGNGKSALMQSLKTIIDSLWMRPGYSSMAMGSNVLNIANFSELLPYSNNSLTMSLTLYFDDKDITSITYSISYIQESKRHHVSEIHIYKEDTLIAYAEPNKADMQQYTKPMLDSETLVTLMYDFHFWDEKGNETVEGQFFFNGLQPFSYMPCSEYPERVTKLIDKMQSITSANESIYLGEDHTYKKRTDKLHRQDVAKEDINGDYLVHLLGKSEGNKGTSEFYERTMGKKLLVKKGDNAFDMQCYSIMLKALGGEALGGKESTVNIVDSGSQNAKLLPMIIAAEMIGKNGILQIEHPDSCLSKFVFREFIEHLASKVKSKDSPRFLLEVGSMDFVDSIRDAIKSKIIDVDDFAIHVVDEDYHGNHKVKTLSFNADGEIAQREDI